MLYLSDTLQDIDLDKLNDTQIVELFKFYEQLKPYEVPPKLQNLDEIKTRFISIDGGRGGGKSEAVVRFLIKEVETLNCNVMCIREIQDSIEDSSLSLFLRLIKIVSNPYDWTPTGKKLCHKNGGKIIFRGMNERSNKNAAKKIKGADDIKYFWADEAEFLSAKSIEIITPSIRAHKNKIIFTYNIQTEVDPVKVKFKDRKRKDTTVIVVNYYDNPFFPQELEDERQEDLNEAEEINNFDLYNHKWLGYPVSQDKAALILNQAYQMATSREVEAGEIKFVGVDVAREGKDNTVFYMRAGLKLVNKAKYTYSKWGLRDASFQADELEKFVFFDKNMQMNIDRGKGEGLIDEMRKRGYKKVIDIAFGSRAKKHKRYSNIISEMAYEFAQNIDTYDLRLESGNQDLMVDLCQRMREIRGGRLAIEQKNDFKSRVGRSPDDGDALFLCYYNNTIGMEVKEKERAAMKTRREYMLKRRGLNV